MTLFPNEEVRGKASLGNTGSFGTPLTTLVDLLASASLTFPPRTWTLSARSFRNKEYFSPLQFVCSKLPADHTTVADSLELSLLLLQVRYIFFCIVFEKKVTSFG
jgi:hypothetical protein